VRKRRVINTTKWNLDCEYPRHDMIWGGTMNRLILRSLVTLSLLCFSLVAARQARADSVDYTWQFGGNTFTWSLPTNPVISSGNVVPGLSFTIPGVSFNENGVPSTLPGTVDFFSTNPGNDPFPGGFDLYTGNFNFLADTFGLLLYGGSEGAPTLSTGTFILTEIGPDGVTPIGTGTLTATPVSTTIPEPSTILLMAIGVIGLAITVLRKN
jgi:hypothetical protein